MRRWTAFNVIGAIGFGLQLAVLAVLLRLGLHYLVATALAVECALVHNFLWHERWTWRDRGVRGAARSRRLWRFHLLNGSISLAGNLLLMAALVAQAGVPPIAANVLSVLTCALVTFVASDRLVFLR